MHEKLIKQLRNTEHCSGCPYDEDCNEFDSCLMDLLAADAIEDMSKRIAKLEKELQEKDAMDILSAIEYYARGGHLDYRDYVLMKRHSIISATLSKLRKETQL